MITPSTYHPAFDFAEQIDRDDPLSGFRKRFFIPQHKGKDSIYLCGNSLGLQPTTVEPALMHELQQWREHGVEGHFRGDLPWVDYHRFLNPQSAHIAGARESEVVVMNTLTTNLHLMMVSFYRPTPDRFKIIMEGGAFPSDQYAVESQVRFHGFEPQEAIVEVVPRPGESTLRNEDILEVINLEGAQTALVLFGGVNYFSGQLFDFAQITKAGHQQGCRVGFDLAHAAGNVPLNLHDSGADFGVWCSYKYLNSGPGGPGGVFVHERHTDSPELPRFAGWWGHDDQRRFLMEKGFVPMKGAAGWQLSNAQIFSFAAHRASLDIFREAGIEKLREKSIQLTGYLEYLIDQINERQSRYQIITPRDPQARGCQLSILTGSYGRELFDYLTANGVYCDWREPNLDNGTSAVIRVAPVPLYNNFKDVWKFAELLEKYRPV